MTVLLVQSLKDPRFAAYRGVSEPELLRERGVFIAEGRLVVERVLAQGGFQVQSLLLNRAAYAALEPFIARLAADVPVYVAQADEFLQLTGHDFHRGCLALVERPEPPWLDELLTQARRVVVLEGVTDPSNVGSVFRNAAAFGVDAVLLSPTTCDPLYRKAIRTSQAASLRIPFARMIEDAVAWPDTLRALAARGFQLIALTPREPAQDLGDFARSNRAARLALLVGTEGEGLSAAAEACAQHRVRIPISQNVDSLNLATAVGIALHRLWEPPN